MKKTKDDDVRERIQFLAKKLYSKDTQFNQIEQKVQEPEEKIESRFEKVEEENRKLVETVTWLEKKNTALKIRAARDEWHAQRGEKPDYCKGAILTETQTFVCLA